MKNNTTTILLIVAIILLIVLLYAQHKRARGATQHICFELPTTADTTIFGPKYWAAFHTLAANIPCGGCRGFAEKFMIFFHDMVNQKLGKPLQDEANFKQFTHLIADIDKGVDVWAGGYVLPGDNTND